MENKKNEFSGIDKFLFRLMVVSISIAFLTMAACGVYEDFFRN